MEGVVIAVDPDRSIFNASVFCDKVCRKEKALQARRLQKIADAWLKVLWRNHLFFRTPNPKLFGRRSFGIL